MEDISASLELASRELTKLTLGLVFRKRRILLGVDQRIIIWFFCGFFLAAIFSREPTHATLQALLVHVLAQGGRSQPSFLCRIFFYLFN